MFWLIGLIFSIGGSLINLLLLVAALIFVVDALFGRRKTMWYFDTENTETKRTKNKRGIRGIDAENSEGVFYFPFRFFSILLVLRVKSFWFIPYGESGSFLLYPYISTPFTIGNNLLHYTSPFYVLIINLYVIISFVKRHENFFFYIKLLSLGGKNFICLMLD